MGLILAMALTTAYSLIIYGDVAVDHLFGPAKFVYAVYASLEDLLEITY